MATSERSVSNLTAFGNQRHVSAGGSSGTVQNSIFDWSKSFLEIQRMCQTEEKLASRCDKRKQYLESLKLRKAELLSEVTCVKEQHLTQTVFLKGKDTEHIRKKGERSMTEVQLLEGERQRLTQKFKKLQRLKSELELKMHSHKVFEDFLQQVVKQSQYEGVREHADHLESLLHLKDQLFQKDNNHQEQIISLRTELVTLEGQSDLMKVHRRNQLSLLQSELETARSEAFQWEQKWNYIEETAAKKTLLLGKIKMGSLSLYEMTLDRAEKAVDVNDTDTQLNWIQQYIQDHSDIVEQHRSTTEQQNGQRE